MRKVIKELEKIEQLRNEAIELLHSGLIDASLMYCRKIVEGISFIIQSSEKIDTTKRNSQLTNVRTLEKHIVIKYRFPNTEEFFDRLRFLQDLGNRAAHFTVDDQDIRIHPKEIEELLKFVFDWFKDFIINHQTVRKTKDLYFDKNNVARPFCIKHIEIENYQTLKKVELTEIPIDSRFIVLTGDNGEGKTSILQAIAIGMYGDYDENSNFILSDNPKVNITIEAKHKSQTIFNEYKGFRNQFTNIEKNFNLVAYGASRLQLQSNESQDIRHTRQSNIYGVFKTDNILQNIEYWIKIQYLNGNDARVGEVLNLLTKLMPSIEGIMVGNQEKKVRVKKNKKGKMLEEYIDDFPILYIENGIALTSEQLSAGNKSILAMIGDMIIRLYSSQKGTINPSDLYGIVLIDELETHLHPKWQKEFPKLLTVHFPLIQFFISTHSPIVFLGMPSNTVFYNISKDKQKRTTVNRLNIDIKNMMPHQILTSSLFGMDNIRNVNNEGIEELNVETEHEIRERKRNEEVLRQISRGFKFKIPKE